MPTYYLRHGTGDIGPFEAPDDATARAIALNLLRYWFDPDLLAETSWAEVRLIRAGLRGGPRAECDLGVTVRRFDPARAATCPDGAAHAWADHCLAGDIATLIGGGLRITNVCRKCGTEVITETWCLCEGTNGPHEHIRVDPGAYREVLADLIPRPVSSSASGAEDHDD